MRFTSTRDIENKLVGSVIYCPKEADFFYVESCIGDHTVQCVEFSKEDVKKNRKLPLNVEDPEHLSLKCFFPGYINTGVSAAYWYRRSRRSWSYGYGQSHSVWRNSVLGPNANIGLFGFSSCVLTPEGHDALHGRYPNRDEALWVAKRDDPSNGVSIRAFSKHLGFAKDHRGKIAVVMDGFRIGHVHKDMIIVTRLMKKTCNTELFKKVFASLPFDAAIKDTTAALEGDEPDFAVQKRRPRPDEAHRPLWEMMPREVRIEDLLRD